MNGELGDSRQPTKHTEKLGWECEDALQTGFPSPIKGLNGTCSAVCDNAVGLGKGGKPAIGARRPPVAGRIARAPGRQPRLKGEE